ncbi:aminotransferase class I/II-fold pyridoxal phosphate-dependent enzyme [Halolamina sp. CBA1230]|uniref:pyridoxal phosphate-dependent aminotransferase n=1 Tax=Halolamina sp. CBA1230 TaxID=1853690 RepID=UPI0009A1E05A|nr:aminotransferase class I/II-fold pyridoxal phosphate-dependent enzyme [Halolamina sp. CBA1230]QKY20254.1 aminotransferase class I/II-fold pyridoxal phosphate-dependent enzyme [Halolamina sp. CBA1230]
MKVADRARETPPSGIRKFFELAEEADDVISLGVGEPDFSAPWAAREAAIHALERGRTSYTANRGRADLRRGIADHVARYDHDYDPESEILVTAGASEAVDLAMRALVDPGDTVAVPQPSYISYGPAATFAGADVLPVPTRAEDAFELTIDALRDAGAGAADTLIFCYPNNPTGAVMDADALAPVAEFAREHDLTVIADEIYAALTYGGEHDSIATLPGMRGRTVVIGGFSKAYAMTGLRLGYALAPPEAIEAMNRIHQYTMLSAPTTAQFAGLEAIRSCDDAVAEMRDAYDRRRRYVLSRFREMGLDCFEAEGAFYVFPECPGDDEAFAEDLLTEEGVAVVPGSVFGEGGEGHLRVSYATGMDELREATARIERFLD